MAVGAEVSSVKALTKQVEALKRAWLLTLLGLLAWIGLGLVGVGNATVEAQRFVLRDGEGRIMAELGGWVGDGPVAFRAPNKGEKWDGVGLRIPAMEGRASGFFGSASQGSLEVSLAGADDGKRVHSAWLRLGPAPFRGNANARFQIGPTIGVRTVGDGWHREAVVGASESQGAAVSVSSEGHEGVLKAGGLGAIIDLMHNDGSAHFWNVNGNTGLGMAARSMPSMEKHVDSPEEIREMWERHQSIVIQDRKSGPSIIMFDSGGRRRAAFRVRNASEDTVEGIAHGGAVSIEVLDDEGNVVFRIP